ncbi:MAG: phytanoyl-CoA dioxygenase family protein [Planctomycetes bacterium]|nr:phytanoyl-CoA dioxygenase family protein [Planctomycetota bacterium]
MSPKVLTPDQIEQFTEEGYTLLREAFPRELAARVKKAVLDKIDAREDDPSTWKVARNHIADSFTGEPFMSACTPRYEAALDDLMGEGRWVPIPNLGWWPVLFPGFDAPPWRVHENEWHIDGGFFHHHLDSPEQGMLPIFVFSDIGPGDGGTGIAVGSHKVAARILRDAGPAGLTQAELGKRVAAHPRRVLEVNGNAGDIAMIHPFMLHTVSTNTGRSIRVICNPHVNFRERMNVTGDPARPISVVERSIILALGEPAPASL